MSNSVLADTTYAAMVSYGMIALSKDVPFCSLRRIGSRLLRG